MVSVAKPPLARNIAESLKQQLRWLFGTDADAPGDVTIVLHGSILDPRDWDAAGRRSDIDLLVIAPLLTRRRLDDIYARLSRIVLRERPVLLETRIGPLCAEGDAANRAVTLQPAVIESLDALSPVALQLLDLHAETIVGDRPAFGRHLGIDPERLDALFADELAGLRDMVGRSVLPCWSWSETGTLRRIESAVPARSPGARAKLRKYVQARLYGWSVIAATRGIGALAGFAPAEMIALGRRADDAAAFLALAGGPAEGEGPIR